MENLKLNTTPPPVVSRTMASPPQEAASSKPAQEPKIAKPVEFFSSPKGKIDSEGLYVVQFRDAESGDVKMEYPSKKASGAYQLAATSIKPPAKESGGSSEVIVSAPAPAPAPSKAPEAQVSAVSEEA